MKTGRKPRVPLIPREHAAIIGRVSVRLAQRIDDAMYCGDMTQAKALARIAGAMAYRVYGAACSGDMLAECMDCGAPGSKLCGTCLERRR